jgi:hypothetical protein
MPYVMVPVPEEYVTQVMQLVIDMTKGTTETDSQQWGEAAAEKFLADADDATRSLVSLLAKSALDGRDVTDQNAADFLQLSMRDTVALIRQVNGRAADAGLPALVELTTATTPIASGQAREVRVLSLREDVARFVQERGGSAARDAERGGGPAR